MPKNFCIMQIWAEPEKAALPICNYSQILYQFLTFTQNLKRSPIPVFLFPTIVAFCVQSFVCVPSLSSPLLLRISPHTFAFIPILPMSLSSRKRSIFNAFCHILPCVAPVCKDMHYHKTGVPWQIMRTLIFLCIY